MEHEALERLAALRHDEQAMGRAPSDKRLLDRAAAGDELLAIGEQVRGRDTGTISVGRSRAGVTPRPIATGSVAERAIRTGWAALERSSAAIGIGTLPGWTVIARPARPIIAAVGKRWASSGRRGSVARRRRARPRPLGPIAAIRKRRAASVRGRSVSRRSRALPWPLGSIAVGALVPIRTRLEIRTRPAERRLAGPAWSSPSEWWSRPGSTCEAA